MNKVVGLLFAFPLSDYGLHDVDIHLDTAHAARKRQTLSRSKPALLADEGPKVEFFPRKREQGGKRR